MAHGRRIGLDVWEEWLTPDDEEEEGDTPPLPTANTLQALTFHLGGELYGIDVLKVRELIATAPCTPIPNLPDHIKGVINLRGLVVPVLDLGLRFGLGATPCGKYAVIIVVESGGGRLTGLVVETVADVVALARDAVQPPPATADTAIGMTFLQGMVASRAGMIILIDPDRLLARETLLPGSAA